MTLVRLLTARRSLENYAIDSSDPMSFSPLGITANSAGNHVKERQVSQPSSLAEALDNVSSLDRGIGFYGPRGELEVRLTFGEVRAKAKALASRLLGLGLKRGEAVGIIGVVHADFVCAFFACQYAGLVAVPLPLVTGIGAARGYQQQLSRVLAKAHARAALGPAAFHDHLRQASDGLDLRAICSVPELAEMPASSQPLKPLGAKEISHIQFSSGSTSFPKGIQISQAALMANLVAIIREGVRVTSEDRLFSWLPFYHDMGLIGAMLVPPVAGIDADYLATDAFVRRPLLWPQLISERRSTISFSPTFGYDLAARRAGRLDANLDLSCWRAAGIGGDMIQRKVLEQFSEAFAPMGFRASAFQPSYGLAESTLAVSFGRPGEGVKYERVDQAALERPGHNVRAADMPSSATRDVISCGIPLPDHVVQVWDQNRRALPDGYIGSINMRGPSLMDGYFRDDAATRETLSPDRWLDTGDMGYLSKGALFITGRKKDMIIINGRNVWPQDIEWHAEQSVPGIRSRDTAAFLHRDEAGQEKAVLLVECRLTDPDELRTLKKEVHAAVLRNVGVDCQVELVPPKTLPFTTSGKLMRAQAREHWLELRIVEKEKARLQAPAVGAEKDCAGDFFGEICNLGGAGAV